MEFSCYGNSISDNILIQPVDEHDWKMLDSEINYIKELSGSDDFYLIAAKVDNWNDDLSPWQAPPVFGNDAFGGYGKRSLDEITKMIERGILSDKAKNSVSLYIGGYSLAGLFALWGVYRTDMFKGAAAVSPSVWFPGFDEYIDSNNAKTQKVYLSLGDKEEKTKNPVMATVGDAIKSIHKRLEKETDCFLEWNEGNHFKEPELRTAKGFAWLLGKR